jgi:hypothetical protein
MCHPSLFLIEAAEVKSSRAEAEKGGFLIDSEND